MLEPIFCNVGEGLMNVIYHTDSYPEYMSGKTSVFDTKNHIIKYIYLGARTMLVDDTNNILYVNHNMWCETVSPYIRKMAILRSIPITDYQTGVEHFGAMDNNYIIYVILVLFVIFSITYWNIY